MKILVTGGAGFIGSHVAERYIGEGHEVIIIDDLSTGREENLPEKCRFYRQSLLDPELLEILRKEKPDIVNHHAAQMNVRKSVSGPMEDAEINILGSLNLLEACRKIRAKKIIFASTGGAIYGEQIEFPADENHPTNPRSPYGIAKLAIEKYLQFYSWTHSLPFVILRYANVYGPRQNGHGEAGVVAIFIEKLLQQERPLIFGDGQQTRDFVYIDDVVACNVEALRPEVVGTFNVATGIETDIATLAEELIRLMNDSLSPQYAPPQLGEQRRSCVKRGALQKGPPIPLSEGLKKTVAWQVGRSRSSA